jgi:deoxyribonuclease-4
MLPDGRRLGAHLAMRDGLLKAADRAVEIGATALQIFSDNPTAWRRRAEPSPEIPAVRDRLAAGDVAPLAIHASYLINLAGANPTDHDRSVELLGAELVTARRFGAALVNVHIGSHGGAGVDSGIARLVAAVRDALELEAEQVAAEPALAGARPAAVVLENAAGGGTAIGTDLDELGAIAAALDASSVPPDRVAFCLDTAHAWGAGLDLSDPAAIDDLLGGFDRHIGIGRLALIHLNDSRSERGSRLDRHEHVGAGRIGEAGLAHLLRHPLLAGVTYILETPGMEEGYDAINLDRAIALATGRPLAPLPAAAFSLRGRRTRAATPAASAEPAAR